MPKDQVKTKRIPILMTEDMHSAVHERWRTIPGCSSAGDYVRKLIEDDLNKENDQ